MYSVKKGDQETHDALRSVVDALNNGTRQMETIATPEALWDQMWIHYGKQRLPKQTLDSWEQYRNREGMAKLPTLNEFKRFLEVKAKGRREFETEEPAHKMEKISDTEQFSQEQNNHGPRNRNNNQNNNRNNYRNENRDGNRHDYRKKHESRYQPYNRDYQQRSTTYHKPEQSSNTERALVELNRCPMNGCTQTHPVFVCDLFKQAGMEARIKVVNDNRLCRCCLKPGHVASTCTYPTCSQCPDDRYKHNYRVCKKAKLNYGGNQKTTTSNPFSKSSATGAQ